MSDAVLEGFFSELVKLSYTLKSSIPTPLKMPRINSPVNPANKVTRILTKRPKTRMGDSIPAPKVVVPVADTPIAR